MEALPKFVPLQPLGAINRCGVISKTNFPGRVRKGMFVLPSLCLYFSATRLFYGWLATEGNLKSSAFCCTTLGTMLCLESRILKLSKSSLNAVS